MEGSFGFPIGGDPEDLMRGLREFAEKQAESVAEAMKAASASIEDFVTDVEANYKPIGTV